MSAAAISPPSTTAVHAQVTAALADAPLVGVVRTHDGAEGERQARLFIAGGIRLVEITFTVPDATGLVARLLAEREAEGEENAGYVIGMGTVTNAERARRAVAAGAEFIVSPNVSRAVAEVAREAGRFLVVGALTPTEIVAAHEAGADLVKVFPLPPVGGPDYLRAVRGPLGDVPMLGSGGYGPEEIAAYRDAGASAFGIGAPLLAGSEAESLRRIAGAVALARGHGPDGSGEGSD
ncbi:MAG TPA: hypothetical protein VKU40_19585 [Thermoanaerobaculia bacterium]|nr:hypothetical protein [Thermoanaerobaculia bacterium]